MMGKQKLIVTDKLESTKEIDGSFTYTQGSPEDYEIIVSKNSQNPSETLIHECIHSALAHMETIPEVKKLAHRINRREDFICLLASHISSVVKFHIGDVKT